jgi:hypothetical protein
MIAAIVFESPAQTAANETNEAEDDDDEEEEEEEEEAMFAALTRLEVY